LSFVASFAAGTSESGRMGEAPSAGFAIRGRELVIS
jgi:hypothetical protein